MDENSLRSLGGDFAGVRLPEAREAQVGALQAALIKGEQSGPPQPLYFDDFKFSRRASQSGV